MRWMLAGLLLAVAVCGCVESPQLHSQAAMRAAQIAGSCDPHPPLGCLSHEGFVSVTPIAEGDWYGEVLVASTAPLTKDRAISLWLASPAHRAVLMHPGLTHYGYAQSDADGWWYAVMIVEGPR